MARGQDTIIALEEEAARGGTAVGLDIATGEPCDPATAGIYDNYLVKRQARDPTLAGQIEFDMHVSEDRRQRRRQYARALAGICHSTTPCIIAPHPVFSHCNLRNSLVLVQVFGVHATKTTLHACAGLSEPCMQCAGPSHFCVPHARRYWKVRLWLPRSCCWWTRSYAPA